MSKEKSMAVATVVSAILSKPGIPPAGPGGKPTNPAMAEGFSIRLVEGKVCLFDSQGTKMTLEELIQYVDRYLT